MYKKIGDYGVIGNLYSVALVGLDGSIDWCCLPYFDSPSVFAALLDERRGGFFSICPTGDWDSVAHYLKTTNILSTAFRTRTGVMVLIDFMPVAADGREAENAKRPQLLRMVQITEGSVEVRVEFFPQFDYARAETTMTAEACGIFARGGEHSLALCCNRPGLEVQGDRALAVWQLQKGDYVWFDLHFDEQACQPFDPQEGGRALRETEAFWHDWLQLTDAGNRRHFGPMQAMIDRSALVLKLLQYRPTGAIAAAATTSLPEQIGGSRNWDYRFSWVRDTAFTVDALFSLGYMEETERYLRWIEKLITKRGGNLTVFYDLEGEKVGEEVELPHLEGYKGSQPVRIGNDAVHQQQNDIYGEILEAAYKLSRFVGKIDIELWPFLQKICATAQQQWREKDRGIWEMRSGPYHFVSSKMLCWVALDRGIAIARRYGFPADLAAWEEERDAIRKEVLEKGWHEEKQAFVQHYDTDALDASALLLPIFGFIPYDDPRMVATVAAIRRELGHEGFLYRYRPHQTDDGLIGEDGVFLVCSFWLIENLIGQGELEEAERLLYRMERVSNHLGLFSEEYDLRWQTSLGNFPQALTHIGFIHAVIALSDARAGQKRDEREEEHDLPGDLRKRILIGSDFLLNAGEAPTDVEPAAVAGELKREMNLLQGVFFDSAAGRVAYEQMHDSEEFKALIKVSRRLQGMEPAALASREERLAFWLNVYNVLVIHGVVALDIGDSVQEVPRFFRRVRYRIGAHDYSADDIEHGILRGNRRLPHSLFRPFGKNDPRLAFVVEPLEPRIHFALVCAARSCPPIEVYQADKLDAQLDLAAATFLNAGAAHLDREKKTVRLSEIFRWYADDFGATPAERLRFVAGFLYQDTDKKYLTEHAGELTIDYIDYDWRLNRR